MLEVLGYSIGVIEIVLCGSLFLVFLIQFLYYALLYGKVFAYKKPVIIEKSVPVSIIICAKNEEVNLKNFLPHVLEQDYNDYEVIVVNDCSEDETQAVINSLSNKYPHLRYTRIIKDEKFTHGKKLAQLLGIKAAKHELLVFTDADCRPLSNNWLKYIVSQYKENTQIVLGYSGFKKDKGILNKIIRYDAYSIAIQYFSYAMARIPYMGVGRNLSYLKSLFFDNKGFASHLDLESGDDDLFVNETASKVNTEYILIKDAQTQTIAPNTFFKWINQKARHISTFKRYKLKHKILLSIEPISRFAFYTLFIVNLFYDFIIIIALIMFGLRLILQLIVNYFYSKNLAEKDLFLISPLMDIISIFTNIIVLIKGVFRRKKMVWR